MNLPYGDELIDVKVELMSYAYLDDLDEYIRADILIPGRYAFPVLGKVNNSKQYASGHK